MLPAASIAETEIVLSPATTETAQEAAPVFVSEPDTPLQVNEVAPESESDTVPLMGTLDPVTTPPAEGALIDTVGAVLSRLMVTSYSLIHRLYLLRCQL